MSDVGYDELGMLVDNAQEVGLPWRGRPAVRREWVELPHGKRLSLLVWGAGPGPGPGPSGPAPQAHGAETSGPAPQAHGAGNTGTPELVLIHGGAQNAHTWDTVALALDRPLVAIDLPGHGHSDWRDEHDYWPPSMADDVAIAIERFAPNARAVVGMSLGGLTAICLAAQHPHLVRRLGIVDVTPGTDHKKAEGIVAFITGPEHFASFDEILARTIEHNPTRTESSLRRGVLHNARELPDGRWSWRYDPARTWKASSGEADVADYFGPLWEHVDRITAPVTLYLGGRSPVVGAEDVDELRRRQPGVEVHTVADAGHSIQGDQPLELARLLGELLA